MGHFAKAFVITLKDNDISEKGADLCIKSSKRLGNEFEVKRFDATYPDEAAVYMSHNNLNWNYPWEGYEFDAFSGLRKSAYQTANPGARIACAISHYRLWKDCAKQGYPYVILEHDCLFQKKVESSIVNNHYKAIGINDPTGATRKWRDFRQAILNDASDYDVIPVPTIDEYYIPQGLAGHSAYIIKPEGAREMLEVVKTFGLWPNDAIMCKQLIKGLGVSKHFYTRIQMLQSTTTT